MHKNAPRLIPLSGQALPLSPDGSPPTDFTLIPAGPLTTVYGTFDWTVRSAKSVAAQWAKRNRRFMWDYEHFSTAKDKDGKPITDTHARRAAGNATPLADPSGFHMRSQSWTPDAAGYISKQEYLYYSPVIAVDEESNEIIDVLKSALTNDPATLGCAPLMLSTLGLEALVNDAAVGHVLSEGEALTDSYVSAKRQENAPALSVQPMSVQSGLQPLATVPTTATALAAVDPCPSDKLSGLYDPNTDPSVPGSAASKLPSFSELSGADGVVPALHDAFGALLATHGLPQQPAAFLSPSMTLNTLGGVVTHDPELYVKDESLAWDVEAARLRVWAWAGDDFLKARPAFSYVKGDGSSRDDYMLIHHDVKGDTLVTVRGGVLEAVNSIGWKNVPSEFLAEVRQHLQAEAARFGDRAPWVELSALAYRVLGKEPPTVALTVPTVPLSADSDKHTLAMAAHPHGSPAKHTVSSVLVHNADTGHTLWGRRHDSDKFTSPGGHVKEGEHPVDAATRELKEETGLDLPRHQLSYMGTVRLSHPVNGSPMDVHGYSCTIPSHVKPDHEKDPEKEVKGWVWHAEHPLAEMHAPVNALSVLSTAKMGSAKGFASLVKQTEQTTTADLTTAPKLALDDNDSEMDMNTLKALTATFISSGSGEGLTPEVEQKRQVALAAVKALDDALAATGAKDGAVDLGSLISLSAEIERVTGAKTGQVGAIISLAARAEVQPIALQLSQDQLKANYVELAFGSGRINGKTRADVTAKIKSLSLADCEQLTKGPKIYEAPNQQGAPQGDNSATRTVELASDRGQPVNQGITSAPPPSMAGKQIELSAADESAIRQAAANIPGLSVEVARQKVLDQKKAQAAGQKLHPMLQPPAVR